MSHYSRDVFDTVVRRGLRLNEGSFNILGGAIQRWVRLFRTGGRHTECKNTVLGSVANRIMVLLTEARQCRLPSPICSKNASDKACN